MNTVDIFSAGLGLTEPWFVSDVQLIPSEESHELELHITVDFKRGAKFNILDDDGNLICDANGQPLELNAADTVERTWRHLNFFQYRTFLHARVPKVRWNGKCPQVSVPWARKHSDFTLL